MRFGFGYQSMEQRNRIPVVGEMQLHQSPFALASFQPRYNMVQHAYLSAFNAVTGTSRGRSINATLPLLFSEYASYIGITLPAHFPLIDGRIYSSRQREVYFTLPVGAIQFDCTTVCCRTILGMLLVGRL